MTLRRETSPNPDAALLEGAPGIDEAWVRRWARGRALTVGYLLLGVLAVAVGSPAGLGPFGWLASAQGALLGTASPIVSAVIAYALLAVPLVWLLRWPAGATTPLLLGAQHAFDLTRRPRFIASAPRRLREARASRAGSLAIAVLAVLGGAAGWLLSQRPAADVGRPLPALTGAQAVAASGSLPRLVRLTGVKDQPGAAWTYDHHVRQTFYRDAYVPLTAPEWRAGERIDILELDRLLPADAPSADNRFDPPGPREGVPVRGLEAWRAAAMARAGLHLSPRVLVLERRDLKGVTPGPDWVVGFVWLDVAFAVAFVSALMAWRFSREVSRLRASQAEASL